MSPTEDRQPQRGEQDSVCSVPECGRPLLAKGLCGTHYSRLWRTGTVGTAERLHPGRRVPPAFSDEQKAAAVADYLAGEHSYNIAVSLGTNSIMVLKWVREAGHRVRTTAESKQLDRERRAAQVADARPTASGVESGKRLNTAQTITKHLTDAGYTATTAEHGYAIEITADGVLLTTLWLPMGESAFYDLADKYLWGRAGAEHQAAGSTRPDELVRLVVATLPKVHTAQEDKA